MTAPFVFLVNAGSGRQASDEILELLRDRIPPERQGGWHILRPGDDFRRRLDLAVADCRSRRGILVAVGGDGTVNAVIGRALSDQVPMAVLPRGTFNYFARAHGIPVEPEEAVQALLDSEPVRLPVSLVNGAPFIVNLGLGLHADMIAARERVTRITGRNRFVAMVSGVFTLLRQQYRMRARLELDGKPLRRSATVVLVSGNRLQLESLGLAEVDRVDQGWLAVLVMQPLSWRDMFALLWRHLRGRLEEADGLERFWAHHLVVHLLRPFVRVVLDGELRYLRTPLHVRMQPDALTCWLPRPKPMAEGRAEGGESGEERRGQKKAGQEKLGQKGEDEMNGASDA